MAGNLLRSPNTCFQVNHHIGLLGNFSNDDGDGGEDTLLRIRKCPDTCARGLSKIVGEGGKGLYLTNFAGCFLLHVSEKKTWSWQLVPDDLFQLLFCFQDTYVCSQNKQNGLFHHQIQTAEWFDVIFCFPITFNHFFLKFYHGLLVLLSGTFGTEILVPTRETSVFCFLFFFFQKVLCSTSCDLSNENSRLSEMEWIK